MRERFNPLQAQLIPPHVTLCREDEVEDWDLFQRRPGTMPPFELALGFGAPVRDGNLVFLPVIAGQEEFAILRARLLPGGQPRQHHPHLTIIHPRNGTCSDSDFRWISEGIPAFQAVFREVSLIEQTDGGPWRRFARFGTFPSGSCMESPGRDPGQRSAEQDSCRPSGLPKDPPHAADTGPGGPDFQVPR